jgi:Domain of unknown function (DUF6883)
VFLFRVEELERAGKWSYAIPAYKPMFEAILRLDEEGRATFAVLSGDFLLYNLAYRTSAMSFSGKRSKHGYEGIRTTKSADIPLYKTLIWDLCDALEEQWHTLDVDELADELFRPNLFAVVLSRPSDEIARGVNDHLRGERAFLGAFAVDTGNPVQQRVTVGLLPRVFVYMQRILLYETWRSGDPFNPPPLDPNGHEWWSDLEFAEVRYGDAEIANLPAWPRSPLSDRGALTAQLLAHRGAPQHLERVANELAAMRTDPNMPIFEIDVGTMPDASHAVVEERKLTEYVLNPEHEDGRHKAQLFRELLGIEKSDWRYLADQLKEGLSTAPVVDRVRSEETGVKYHVVVPIRGRNGSVKPVLAAWEVRAGAPPRLTTAYLAPTGIDVDDLASPPPVRLVPQRMEGDERWAELWRLADADGMRAAAALTPSPMRVANEWVPEGEFGSAVVVVRDLRTGFARWLVKSGKAMSARGQGALVFAPDAGVQRAEAYARAFAAVLEANGITPNVSVRLD